jgi:hypothetical protein
MTPRVCAHCKLLGPMASKFQLFQGLTRPSTKHARDSDIQAVNNFRPAGVRVHSSMRGRLEHVFFLLQFPSHRPSRSRIARKAYDFSWSFPISEQGLLWGCQRIYGAGQGNQ